VRKVPDGVGTKTPAKSADELSAKDKKEFLAQANAGYKPYKSLFVAFTLKGKIGREELYYEGELFSTPTNLKITLKDAVFLSPLLTLDIGQKIVTLKNYGQNKTESIPRSDYQWVELFGRSFPVRFFEPLMRGFLPEDVSSSESLYARTASGEVMVRTENFSFEAAMYFAENILKKIFYRDKTSGDILVFQMMQLFPARNYPKVLRIEHTRAEDNLTLQFRNLSIK